MDTQTTKGSSGHYSIYLEYEIDLAAKAFEEYSCSNLPISQIGYITLDRPLVQGNSAYYAGERFRYRRDLLAIAQLHIDRALSVATIREDRLVLEKCRNRCKRSQEVLLKTYVDKWHPSVSRDGSKSENSSYRIYLCEILLSAEEIFLQLINGAQKLMRHGENMYRRDSEYSISTKLFWSKEALKRLNKAQIFIDYDCVSEQQNQRFIDTTTRVQKRIVDLEKLLNDQ